MQFIYVYDEILKSYRKVTYGEVKQALESDIAAQGINGYQTGSPGIYQALPEGINEANPQDADMVTFSDGFGGCPIIGNGLGRIGLQYKYESSDSPLPFGAADSVPMSPAVYALKNEIYKDPLNRGYAVMTTSEKVASLNEKNRISAERFITARTLLAEVDPVMAATIYVKIKTAAEQNPVLAMAMDMLTTYSVGGGLDICHANTQAFVDSLIGVVFTEQEAIALKGLNKQSRAQELIGRNITESDLLIV